MDMNGKIDRLTDVLMYRQVDEYKYGQLGFTDRRIDNLMCTQLIDG